MMRHTSKGWIWNGRWNGSDKGPRLGEVEAAVGAKRKRMGRSHRRGARPSFPIRRQPTRLCRGTAVDPLPRLLLLVLALPTGVEVSVSRRPHRHRADLALGGMYRLGPASPLLIPIPVVLLTHCYRYRCIHVALPVPMALRRLQVGPALLTPPELLV